MARSLILSIDQGTSGTKAVVFNDAGEIVVKATVPLETHYLEGGWVEQDAEEIYQNVLEAVRQCITNLKQQGGNVLHIRSCGISNQRETFVLWNRLGNPLHRAVVWQCKRSVDVCERLKVRGLEKTIREKTGLIIDPYFSGSKMMWLHENNQKVKQAVDAGDAFFGTVDSWLLYKLTKGKNYLTDYTNASRTLFFNLKELKWDRDLLELFSLGKLNLPQPKPSSHFFGQSDFEGLFDEPLDITAMIGDSHAAAFGEGCYAPGMAKATMGTGCSIIMNTGNRITYSDQGMVTTICWSTETQVHYALEGVIVTCGATIEWLKNQLQLIADSKETEAIATSVEDNSGVYFIPSFSGLGAPHWDMKRKASITGLTFDTNKKHIVRAALESIPYQIKDVIVAMEKDANIHLGQLMVDGGLTTNRFVIQFLADLLQKPVVNLGIAEVSALGAAYLAGLKSGVFADLESLKKLNKHKNFITPSQNSEKVLLSYEGWLRAIQKD